MLLFLFCKLYYLSLFFLELWLLDCQEYVTVYWSVPLWVDSTFLFLYKFYDQKFYLQHGPTYQKKPASERFFLLPDVGTKSKQQSDSSLLLEAITGGHLPAAPRAKTRIIRLSPPHLLKLVPHNLTLQNVFFLLFLMFSGLLYTNTLVACWKWCHDAKHLWRVRPIDAATQHDGDHWRASGGTGMYAQKWTILNKISNLE